MSWCGASLRAAANAGELLKFDSVATIGGAHGVTRPTIVRSCLVVVMSCAPVRAEALKALSIIEKSGSLSAS